MPTDNRLVIELDLDSIPFDRGMDRSIKRIRVFDNIIRQSNATMARQQSNLRGALSLFRDFSVSTFAITNHWAARYCAHCLQRRGEIGFNGAEFVVETVLTEASQPGPLRNVIGNS